MLYGWSHIWFKIRVLVTYIIVFTVYWRNVKSENSGG